MSDPNAGPTPPVPGGPPPGYGGPPPGYGGPTPGQPVGPPPGQPIAPPPGWTPPGGQPGGPPSAPGGGTKLGTPALLGIVAIAAMALAVSIEEDGDNGWGRIGVWAGFAIFAAVLTLAPAVKEQVNLDVVRAWQVGAAGAVGLAAFWVLFVLPSITQNVSFAATVGVAAGVGAVWLSPGRPASAGGGAGTTW